MRAVAPFDRESARDRFVKVRLHGGDPIFGRVVL
jgi:hypothetical protein